MASTTQGSDTIVLASTKEELLLFWDEKDLYVEAPTRGSKPISQVAENITVVTAKEIEDMNAHSVQEVLNRVAGVFVDSHLIDFVYSGMAYIQGSEHRHVLYLMDGVPLNSLDGGANPNLVPVQIIERIEIIKGPASSAWGSSLGGVVNIVTKAVGESARPSGALAASYGKAASQDDSVQIAGKAGPAGYYLAAGRQVSDGLVEGRSWENENLYAKASVPMAAGKGRAGLSAGYFHIPEWSADYPVLDLATRATKRQFYTNAFLDTPLGNSLKANLNLFHMDLREASSNFFLSTELPYRDPISETDMNGASARLVWTAGRHNAVFGADASHGNLDNELFISGKSALATHPKLSKWALYANDTVNLGRLSVTPGCRWDYNDISGSFFSPSLGLTYAVAEKTVLRAQGARGFSLPPLGAMAGGYLDVDPNPDLAPETVWSYQAGVETGRLEYVWLKATAFVHNLDDALTLVPSSQPHDPADPLYGYYEMYTNKGEVTRKGMELEAETAPFHNFSLKAGLGYVHKKQSETGDNFYTTGGDFGLKYDDRILFMAELLGHYSRWDIDVAPTVPELVGHGVYLWDLHLRWQLFHQAATRVELFASVRNLFNGLDYTVVTARNAERWAEAGLRFKF